MHGGVGAAVLLARLHQGAQAVAPTVTASIVGMHTREIFSPLAMAHASSKQARVFVFVLGSDKKKGETTEHVLAAFRVQERGIEARYIDT